MERMACFIFVHVPNSNKKKILEDDAKFCEECGTEVVRLEEEVTAGEKKTKQPKNKLVGVLIAIIGVLLVAIVVLVLPGVF